jgi:hypothetical protein
MDNFFLPREVGSIETGPQLFVKTEVANTTFYFNPNPESPEGPGLLNSVLVQNGVLGNLNGIFNYTTEFGGKPYYNKDGNGNWFIVWFGNEWGIYDFNLAFDPIYFSSEDVLYPWNVQNWSVLNPVYNPPPTVTKVL